jgi:hypothetical protein
MAVDTNPAGDWAAAMQKAQADMLRQWSELGQNWTRAAAPGTAMPGTAMPGIGAATGTGAAAEGLARHFLQQCEQYLGVSRSLWDLVTRSAGSADPEQRGRVFTEGLAGLQQQFAGLWAATPFGAPAAGGFGGGMPGMGGGAWPGMPSFMSMPGFPGATGAFNIPALGPAREQQESWQRLMQLAGRSAQAQMRVGTQWSDIIGQALRSSKAALCPAR